MQERQMTLQDIPVELLVAHPENSNFMNVETTKKLRRHIERLGLALGKRQIFKEGAFRKVRCPFIGTGLRK